MSHKLIFKIDDEVVGYALGEKISEGFKFSQLRSKLPYNIEAMERADIYDADTGEHFGKSGKIYARMGQGLLNVTYPVVEEVKVPEPSLESHWIELFSSWWFLAGGSLHRLWKTRKYSEILQLAQHLPRTAFREGYKAGTLKALQRVLKIVQDSHAYDSKCAKEIQKLIESKNEINGIES